MPPRWLVEILAVIRRLARDGRIFFTAKALAELRSLELGLSPEDGWDVLSRLRVEDFGVRLYVKVALGPPCRVISFHEDDGAPAEYGS